MSSPRFLAFAAASGLLLFGTGCSQVSSILSKEASNAVVQAVDDALVEEVQAAEPEQAQPEEATTASESLLQQSAEAATMAAAAAENAVTTHEWNQVANHWRTAIAYAASVPEEDSDREAAQAQARDYVSQLETAEAQYAALVQKRYQVFTGAATIDSDGATKTYEADGKQVRTWLQNGEFSQVESLLKAAVQAKKLTRGGAYYADSVLRFALGGDDVVFSPALISQLNQWADTSPNSAYPYIIRAYANQSFFWAKPYLYEQSPDSRESNSRRVNSDNIESLGTPLMFSALDSEKAAQIDPNNPLLRLAELRLARLFATGSGNDKLMEEYFQKVEQVLPSAFESHFEQMLYLLAQDVTGDRALEFLRSRVSSAPDSSQLRMLLPLAHFALHDEKSNAREYLNQPDVWQEIEENSEKAIAAFPNEGIYAAWYAYLADEAERGEIAQKYSQIAMLNDPNGVDLQTWLKIMN